MVVYSLSMKRIESLAKKKIKKKKKKWRLPVMFSRISGVDLQPINK